MKVTKEQINSFIDGNTIAIAGVSRSSKKFGHQVFSELKKKGYNVIPINPHAENIEGESCYKTVKDLPDNIDSLLIVTPKSETDGTLREAIQKGIKNIWVQQMSDTKETLRIAEEYQKEIIFG